MRALVSLGLVVTAACGRVNSELPSDGEAVDSASDDGPRVEPADAFADAIRFDSGAGCPPYLPSGKCGTIDMRCVYVDRCTESADTSTLVQCLRRGTEGSLEWTVVGGLDCWRLLDADGCPVGGVRPGEYCEAIGKVCSYPAQCTRYKKYQAPTCVTDDAKAGVWSATEKDCAK
jgi:hypothetical protein